MKTVSFGSITPRDGSCYNENGNRTTGGGMTSPERRVYLDVCTLCRPFDDQTHIRIRLETERCS
jgi:hypothetical protein